MDHEDFLLALQLEAELRIGTRLRAAAQAEDKKFADSKKQQVTHGRNRR